jgi:hypothetical protein
VIGSPSGPFRTSFLAAAFTKVTFLFPSHTTIPAGAWRKISAINPAPVSPLRVDLAMGVWDTEGERCEFVVAVPRCSWMAILPVRMLQTLLVAII